MIDDKIYRFDELIQETSSKPNLLLGNGFSIDFNDKFKNLNFEKQIEQANVQALVHLLFDENASTILSYMARYQIEKKFIENINNINCDCKPNLKEKKSSLKFLSNFKNIYTLNYDTLIPQIIAFASDTKNNLFNNCFIPNDGFGFSKNKTNGDLFWDSRNKKQNIFYIHGALHLYSNEESKNDSQTIYKLKSNYVYKKSLINIIRERIEKYPPLIVAGGNYTEKVEIIKKYKYLHFCCKHLYNIGGELYIHGHSLNDVDRHIFEILNMNNHINAINISIHQPFSDKRNNILSQDAKGIIEKAKSYFGERIDRNIDNPLNINFYDASSAKIWDLYT